MISVTSQADISVLVTFLVTLCSPVYLLIKINSFQVISARKGEFETGFEKGGQTREHAMLAKTAGVKHLIVLINKMDDPTVNWDEERYKQLTKNLFYLLNCMFLFRYNECKEKLLPYLKKLGFNPQKDLTFMPCSGLTGAGLKEPVDSKLCPWFT
jgi:peptide chain release factor subunit 3